MMQSFFVPLIFAPRAEGLSESVGFFFVYLMNRAVNVVPFSVYSSHVMDSIKPTKPGCCFPLWYFRVMNGEFSHFVKDHNKLIIVYFYTGYFTWALKHWHLHFPPE